MALSLGYKAKALNQGIWKNDPALLNVPPEILADYDKDGSAAHLLPYANNGKPTVFTWRALRITETRGLVKPGMTAGMAWLECFRLAVRFPGSDGNYRLSDGTFGLEVARDESGFQKLTEGFCEALEDAAPGMIDFYGMLIYQASFPSEQEKKASSPPSTTTPSSAAGSSNTDGTAAPQPPAGPAA